MVPNPNNQSLSVAYRVEGESLGRLLRVDRPDDDPELMKYIAACAPAAAKAREALGKPYFLMPIDWTKYSNYGGGPMMCSGLPPERIYPIVNIVSALGVIQAREADTQAEGFACLLDAARLGLLIADDPVGTLYGYLALHYSLKPLRKSAHADHPPIEVLSNKLAVLCKLQKNLPDPVPTLEHYWRQIDKARCIFSFRLTSLKAWGDTSLSLLALRREKREVIKNREVFLEVARLPFPDHVAWRSQRPAPMFEYGPIRAIYSAVLYRAEMETCLNGTIIAIAIEIYYSEHNMYPDSLDALIPDPLEMLPMDPFRGGKGTPFHYRREGDDYLLYSVGRDLLDDGGKTWKDAQPKEPGGAYGTYDLVIHAPAASNSASPTK
jgi:hypothetical protein